MAAHEGTEAKAEADDCDGEECEFAQISETHLEGIEAKAEAEDCDDEECELAQLFAVSERRIANDDREDSPSPFSDPFWNVHPSQAY